MNNKSLYDVNGRSHATANIVIGIQARSGSTRLPFKSLKLLNNKPVWYWVYKAALFTGVPVYMLLQKNDKIMIDNVKQLVFKDHIILGAGEQPLERYKKLIEVTKADLVVRLTADCPLLDKFILFDMINYIKQHHNVSFLYNELDGMDVQIFSSSMLEDFSNEEHVINMEAIKAAGLYAKYEMHLSIDTQEQFEYIEKLFKRGLYDF